MVRSTCPLCSSPTPQVFFERRSVPVHQNTLCDSAAEARSFTRGDLLLAFCKACGFVFNSAFDPSRLRYSGNYDSTQSCSPYFRRYLRELSESLIKKYSLRDLLVIEVGCGKGEFLKMLCKDGRNRGIGYDPSYVGPDTAEQGAVRFVREFYDSHQTQHAPDFLCCRHVIEHVQSPLDLLRAVRQAIGSRMNSRVFFETPSLLWILDTVTFWDFFYEHCSYFTSQGLTWAFQQAGFEVLEAHSNFDEQYISVEAVAASVNRTAGSGLPRDVSLIWSKIQRFLEALNERLEACKRKIELFSRAGGCAVWGAGAKGTTLVNAIDPENRSIHFVVDINPTKQGKFVAGTGHPIVSPQFLKEQKGVLAGIVNMNPNYLEENRSILSQLSLDIPIVSP
jgi:SAM-dependent methyltransferase